MTLRILQFGAGGQLARALIRAGETRDIALTVRGSDEVDIGDPAALAEALSDVGTHDLVLNAAAYTAVDRAESEPDRARAVNASAPRQMAGACARADVPLVHVSTDYVFDGSGEEAWREDDPTGPLNVYGRTKLEGEGAIWRTTDRAAVIRTSWVVSERPGNFLTTMLRLGAERDTLRVVADQHGRPTLADDLARFLLDAAPRWAEGDAEAYGTFHFANDGATTWAGLAEAALAEAGIATPIVPISTADWPTPARRPFNSVLDTGKVERTFGVAPRPWREAVAETVGRIRERV